MTKDLHKALLVITTFILSTVKVNAQCQASSSGDWSDPSIWSCGYVPGCGDLTIIPAGITINLDIQLNIQEANGCNTPSYIQVFGTLRIQTGKKINMSCGSSVEIMSGGLLQHGFGEGMSNWIQICGATEWVAEDGNVPGYALFGSPIPLPTTIISFDINNNESEIEFTWTIQSERNVNRYEVEFSTDAINWTTVAVKNSRGDGTEIYTYYVSIPENSVQSGYFRLRSIDEDGQTATYGKMLVYEKQTEELVVSPNPAGSDQNVTFRFAENQSSAIYVYDQMGNLIYTDLNTDRMESVTINGNILSNGMYIVKPETAVPTLFVIE